MGKVLSVAFICLVLYLCEAASGETWYVDGSVSSSGEGISLEMAFETIQEGINGASDGDTVIVKEGTYVENIKFNGKNIILTSTDPLDPAAVASTIIDGNKAGSVVTFDGTEDESCVLSGFSIQNGTGASVYHPFWKRPVPSGGGICGGTFEDHSRATIERNVITSNSASGELYGRGGGICCCDGAIRNNIISANSASYGGGALADCGGLIEDNTISRNSAAGEGASGGGLLACHGTIRDNAVSENNAINGGGLGACHGIIEGNTITRNTANGGGGLNNRDGEIANNTISSNTAYDGGGLRTCDGTVQDNIITGNSAGGGGGGLDDCGGVIEGNLIRGNSAGFFGGGLQSCDGTIRNNIMAANSANQEGGGLASCWADVHDNLIVGNSAARWGGAMASCHGTVENSTIYRNSAAEFGGRLYKCWGSIRNCIIWGNKAAVSGDQIYESNSPCYCCIRGVIGAVGNISPKDGPRFLDLDGPDNKPDTWGDNDYRLVAGSPCIDAGINEDWTWDAVDLDGNDRIIDGDGDGADVVDIGAYEYRFPFKIIELVLTAGGGTQLKWSSVPAEAYTIWACPDLATQAWVELATVPSQGFSTTWTDSGSTSNQRMFYKIQVD